jgi:hypothetical protein
LGNALSEYRRNERQCEKNQSVRKRNGMSCNNPGLITWFRPGATTSPTESPKRRSET